MRYSPRRSLSLIAILLLTSLALAACGSGSSAPAPVDPPDPFVGHLKHFQDHAYEGTDSCLSCHPTAGAEMLASVHFQYESAEANIEGHAGHTHGKTDFINNFCIALASNEGRCTQCHAGIGWADNTYDRTDPTKIDCLICHDLSGTYVKEPKTAGAPPPDLDLDACAQQVGVPTRSNCLACHAKAGGGDNVKHGDLNTDLKDPTRDMDVHMEALGLDYSCQTCHSTMNHKVPGMSVPGDGAGRVLCTKCHSDAPHENATYNAHTARIACQTCHVPVIGRSMPTKIDWDWSTAGQNMDPIPVDEYGKETYSKLKGTFVWGMDVAPTLRWYNGNWNRMIINENDSYSSEPASLASPVGSKGDANSKIYPFKYMVGKQPADANNHTVLVPHLFGGAGGPNPYWAKFDWDLALIDGAAYTGQTYTGAFEFVQTEMYLAVNHGVAPKAEALTCSKCHFGGPNIDWAALGYDGDPMAGGK